MTCTSTAVLACRDVAETVNFYTGVLGFRQHWLWEDPPTFACVGMGGAELFLCLQPDLTAKIEGHMHCFNVEEDLAALYARHERAGAPIVSPLENKPWGVREYTIRDCNGYHVRFTGPQTYDRPAATADALPSHIQVVVKAPTIEEYVDLSASVGWARHRPSMEQALRNTLIGIVAIDTRNGDTPVGMVRCTGDGKYYMLWDVIVRPSHQGQKIGTAMVDAALVELRRIGAPEGAFVGLFTGKPGFYERLRFKKDFAMHRAL